MEGHDKCAQKKTKVDAESIKVEIFGDILKFSKKNVREILPLKKYDALAMHLFTQSKGERVLVYKFLCGLALSAHARRTNDAARRHQVFELKNKLFLSAANNQEIRRYLNFRFCISKRFKVAKYCEECELRNKQDERDPRKWTFCPKCEVDRTFYNVLSMFHKFKGGGVSMYLGKEHMHLIENLKPVKHVDIDELPEQLSFERFRFTPHNLVSLDYNSLVDVSKKLLLIREKFDMPEATSLAPRTDAPRKYTPQSRPAFASKRAIPLRPGELTATNAKEVAPIKNEQ